MPPYVKQPERVQAIQWTGSNRGQIDAVVPPGMIVWSGTGEPGLVDPISGSIAWIPVSYWILYEGATGLMTDEYFTATYELGV
jgi:hypothetical protein